MDEEEEEESSYDSQSNSDSIVETKKVTISDSIKTEQSVI